MNVQQNENFPRDVDEDRLSSANRPLQGYEAPPGQT